MAGIRGPGRFGKRGIHGPRELGHRSAGRRAVQVRAAVGHRPGQPDGDLCAGDRCSPGGGTRKDFAQCCRDWYPGWTRWPNWLMSEVAIGACDLAEVLGSAVALNLLFHIPLLWAVIITGFDVLLLLALQRFSVRS